MTLTTKIGAGLIATSSVAGLGYAGSKYFGKEEEKLDIVQQVTTISDLITEKYDYILLDTSNDDGNKDKSIWTKNWTAYKEAGDNVFQLTSWRTDVSNLDLTSELKGKCKELANSEKTNDSDTVYGNVTKYCARSVTIADEIEKLELKTKILKTQEEDTEDKSIWDKRVSGKETLRNHFTNLSISFDDADVAKVKAGCSGATSKPKTEGKYSEILEAYKAVCIKQTGE